VASSVAFAGSPWPSFAVVAVSLVSNALLQLRVARGRLAHHDRWLAGVVVIDIVLLTALLALTGGPLNPFTLLYLVHVATAAVATPRRTALGLTVFAVAAYGALFSPGVFDPAEHMRHMHGPGFALHIRGMWLAFAITAVSVVFFVGRLRLALEVLERTRAEKRAEQQRLEARALRLASLATLAGGAAHELSTPLQAISVISDALQRGRNDRAVLADYAADLDDLAREIARCKDVLAHLAADAGAPGGEPTQTFSNRALIDDVVRAVDADRVRVHVNGEAEWRGPRRALTVAVRGLVKNAQQAGPGLVDVDVDATAVVVRDAAGGMDAAVLARAGEPFFTTKAPGEGMGLGLFLARTVIESAGGALILQSNSGGTTVRVELRAPVASVPARVP
jgi:two-component system sensor histidine kinase RegB